MNAQLLSLFSAAAPTKSGVAALLSKAVNAKEDKVSVGASFADLLGQQKDTLDPQLLDMLAALGVELDDMAPQQLQTLLQQIKQADDPKQIKQLLATLPQNQATDLPASVEDNEVSSTDFISSTLFIATESKAIRLGTAATNATPAAAAPALLAAVQQTVEKPIAPNNQTRFDEPPLNLTRAAAVQQTVEKPIAPNNQTRFELKTDGHFNGAVLETSTTAKKAPPVFTPIQTSLNSSTEDLKALPTTLSTTLFNSNMNASSSAATVTQAAPLLSELAALNVPSSPTAQTPQSAASFSPASSAQITTPLNQITQWGADFGRVMVQISQQAGATNHTTIHNAEIRLNPAELGPMRIQLSINDGVANAMFYAAHALTRQAIELSLPQLQQQLAQSGLSLGEANVSDQSFFAQSEQQSGQSQAKGTASFSLHGGEQSIDSDASLVTNTKQSADPNAIIDTFA